MLLQFHAQSLGREDPLEEGMATHSSILAWSIPWTEEPGGLQSMGLQRVWHNWSDLALTHGCMIYAVCCVCVKNDHDNHLILFLYIPLCVP